MPIPVADEDLRDAEAGAEHAGQRLDRFLTAAFPDLSRSRLQALLAEGAVTHAGGTIGDANRRVKPGETYSLRVPIPRPATPQAQDIPLTIVHEDADLIVIDKPAGLVVHPAAGNPDGTLVNALLAHCQDLAGVGGVVRPGIVHRLDKDTSGLLVAAKNERAMRSLAKQFAAHAVERAYNAVIWGAPRMRDGLIEGNLGRSPFDRKRIAVLREQGKPARTRYKTLERFGDGERAFASLIECRLETGRTHQIRVHLAHLGHPLVGDPVYGRARVPPRAKSEEQKLAYDAAAAFPRQALHAGLLGFHHPSLQVTMRFESAWPEDFASLVRALRGLGSMY
jgi:23S rRNA pseudouridine1911/1915/1917 synthase